MKWLFIILASLFAINTTYAQKLPNVQKASVWAPANIKIDGKADEWNDQYQAHNNATDIYYSISNDSENIYLILKITRAFVIDKIIKGNISLTINHTLKKKDDSPVTITYPVLKRADANSVSNLLNSKIGTHNDAAGVDNSLKGLNNLLSTKSKSINVQGIKNIPDDDISVYNDEGIKAVSKFDKPLVYVYELAVPLRYFDLPNNGLDAFSYHIKLNAEKESNNTNVEALVSPMNSGGLPPPPPPARASVATTDFWGEYTLAKNRDEWLKTYQSVIKNILQ
ncbi:hypothetical protein HQ865_07235 [Mucilaginibacter mali]|uniref:DUF4468 domain-containing protein n=1 Tax=Mucilaginibacter mali TaxID=2740462 RepID=A0A7D4TLT9_9SPHI|nr:hypothetical protein [Mucilaginibacter mali]QKJ29553.1 hypothetical protein HQ865_07235 [Mucilaginibacter mali]